MKIHIGPYGKCGENRKMEFEFIKDDFFNLDVTLAIVIHKSLESFKEKSNMFFLVDDEDVPEHLKYYGEESKPNALKYDYVLDEMIWTFNEIAYNSFGEYNEDEEKRITNGLRLFGKYYRGLWL